MSRGGRPKRGDNSFTFSLESIGLTRGDALPPPTLTPPPNYPSIDAKPLALHSGEVDNYLLNLKQELRQSLTTSKYHLNRPKERPKVERYSDKYENLFNENVFNDNDIEIELCPKRQKTKKCPKTQTVNEIDKKLENLVEKEKEDKIDEQNSDKEVEDNGSDNEKVDDLEDAEEGTDYTFSYFDGGDNYLDDSDDNVDEGPTY